MGRERKKRVVKREKKKIRLFFLIYITYES